MKTSLLQPIALGVLTLLTAVGSLNAQVNGNDRNTNDRNTSADPDQNPRWAVSRDKYIRMADSLNAWHGTTRDETYKAIDWMEERKEARADRRAFRRQLRLERANYGFGYDYYGYDRFSNYGYNNYGYNNFNYPGTYRYSNRYGRAGSYLYVNPFRSGYWWR